MKWLSVFNNNTSSATQGAVKSSFLPHLCDAMAVFSLIIACELVAIALVLAASSIEYFSWWRLGLVSMTVQWIMLVSIMLLCKLSNVLSALPLRTAGMLSYTLVLCVSLVVLCVGQYLMTYTVVAIELCRDMLLAAIFSGIMLRFLYLQQQLRYQQEAELNSRIQALHARIRPHFLFNSMNALASLIPINPERAEQVVENLSQLFRVSLREQSLVSLSDEIALCRKYVDIEQVRLAERLRFVWMLDDAADNTIVPSLLLQPLLENAIYHGIQKIPEGGTVKFESWYEEDYLYIRIVNPLPANVIIEQEQQTALPKNAKNNRMAVKNIEGRLQAHYGQKASIVSQQVEQLERGVNVPAYEVLITIPFKERIEK